MNVRRFFLILGLIIGGTVYSQCDTFELELIGLNPSCFGFCDGNVDAMVSGSHGPFSVVQLNEDGLIMPYTPLAYEHCPGWYYVTATDSLGCIREDSILLVEPAEITIEPIITEPSLPPACDGSILIDTVYGYQGDFSSIGFYWTTGLGGIGENEVTDLCNDFYSVTINDEIGCSITEDFALGYARLDEEPALSFDLYPNPTSDFLFLKNISKKSYPLEILLYDINGHSTSFYHSIITDENLQIDISNYSSGTYFIVLKSNNGIQREIIVIK